METLKDRYKADPLLLRIYRKKLMRKEWAGRLDPVEQEYRRQRFVRINSKPSATRG